MLLVVFLCWVHMAELVHTSKFVCRAMRCFTLKQSVFFWVSCYSWYLGLLSFVYCCHCVWIYVWEFTDRPHLQCLSLHIFSVCTEFFRKDQGSYISLSDQLVSCTSHYFIQCWGFQAMLLNPARQLPFPFQLQKALISLVFLSNRKERWVQPSNLHLW